MHLLVRHRFKFGNHSHSQLVLADKGLALEYVIDDLLRKINSFVLRQFTVIKFLREFGFCSNFFLLAFKFCFAIIIVIILANNNVVH